MSGLQPLERWVDLLDPTAIHVLPVSFSSGGIVQGEQMSRILHNELIRRHHGRKGFQPNPCLVELLVFEQSKCLIRFTNKLHNLVRRRLARPHHQSNQTSTKHGYRHADGYDPAPPQSARWYNHRIGRDCECLNDRGLMFVAFYLLTT